MPVFIMTRLAFLDGSSSRNHTGRGSTDQSGKPCTSAVYGTIGNSAGEFRAKKHAKAAGWSGQASLPIFLQFRQYDSFLCLVFSFTVGIAGFAEFVRLQENNLTETFVGVYTRRQRSSVRDFEGNEAFPLRLKRSHVDDDPAPGICALPY